MNEHEPPGRDGQRPLDLEQALADLDQSIADREQALADHDQAGVDHDEDVLEDDRATTDDADFAAITELVHRQGRVDLRQARADARQEQIAMAQSGGDERQVLLNDQQRSLTRPSSGAGPSTPHPSAVDHDGREQAAAQRAVNALERAQEATRRAEAAAERVQAMRARG